MEKNEIYQKLHSIDFNFDNEEDIRMLISNTELYPEFRDEIYSVLYFIVEREKYFKSRGYEGTKMFENVLSDEERDTLLQIFKSRNSEKLNSSIEVGDYLNVLDEEYRKFFNQIEKTRGVPYLEEHPDIPTDDIAWDKFLKYYHNIRNMRNGHIAYHVFGPIWSVTTTEKIGKIYTLKYERNGRYRNTVVFFDENLNRIKPTNKRNDIELYFNGYYLVRNDKAKDEHAKSAYGLTDNDLTFIVLDSNFNFVCRINDSDFLIDRTRKNLLARDKQTGEYTVYDENFKPFKKFKLSGTFISIRGIFNDGIIALEGRDSQIVYFDLDTMDIIKSFQYSNCYSVFGYGEGMYNIVDGNPSKINIESYRTRDGSLAIPRHFFQTHPFASGYAYANIDVLKPGFIDRYGNFTSLDDMHIRYVPEPDSEFVLCDKYYIFLDQEKGLYDIQNLHAFKKYTKEKAYVHYNYQMYLDQTQDGTNSILEAIEKNSNLSISSTQITSAGDAKKYGTMKPKN